MIDFTNFETLLIWVIIAGFSCVLFALGVLASKR